MSRLARTSRPGVLAAWPEMAAGTAVLGTVVVVTLALVARDPGRLGLLLFVSATGLLAVVIGLRSPVLACTYLLATTFFRLAVPAGTLPVDPFLLAFGGVLASTWLWARPRRRRPDPVRLDPIACVMGLYVLWNLVSMVVPHALPAGAPLDPEPFPVLRFVLIGTVMPLTMFLIGRRLFVTERAIRILLWSILATAGYSAVVSVLQFSAPQLVWPTYIAESPNWPERAVGVFNQPVVNGLVLIVGFLVAMLIVSHDRERPALRVLAGGVAVVSIYAVYLTHTRVTWLTFALVVLIGAAVAKGFRAAFVITGAVVVGAVAATWSRFTSADRAAGGVGSPEEVHDRLNNIATSLWAFSREPLTGWGIGRFPAVNTHHHQSWSPAIPWERGYGIASHLDSLGILVELGIVGLVLWLTILALVSMRLVEATRRLPAHGMYGRALGLTALLCLLSQVLTGLTVDLRFFDFPNIVVLLFAGATIAWQRELERGMPARPAAVISAAPAASGRPVREAVRP